MSASEIWSKKKYKQSICTLDWSISLSNYHAQLITSVLIWFIMIYYDYFLFFFALLTFSAAKESLQPFMRQTCPLYVSCKRFSLQYCCLQAMAQNIQFAADQSTVWSKIANVAETSIVWAYGETACWTTWT